MKKTYKVYKLTNLLNGKCYIGITSRTVGERWSEHVANSRGTRKRHSKIYDAIAKYGSEAFSREVVEEVDTEEHVRYLEIFYIAQYNSFNRGYNSNPGGNGFLEFPDHIKRKISEAQKGKIISVESRDKMSKAKLGDKRCASNFGKHVSKGAHNPRAKSYLIRFPDGTEHMVTGFRAFCREQCVTGCKLLKNGKTKGFILLKRFNDHPEREYTQAGGSGEYPAA